MTDDKGNFEDFANPIAGTEGSRELRKTQDEYKDINPKIFRKEKRKLKKNSTTRDPMVGVEEALDTLRLE